MIPRPAYKSELTLLREFYAVWREFQAQATAARESPEHMDRAGALAQRLVTIAHDIDNVKRIVVPA